MQRMETAMGCLGKTSSHAQDTAHWIATSLFIIHTYISHLLFAVLDGATGSREATQEGQVCNWQ